MDFPDLILKRRSVRSFTDEPVPDEKLRAVLSAGLLAPTSRNKKPCELYAVTSREVLEALSRAKGTGAGLLADAPAAIVVLADEEVSDVWVEDSSIALSYLNLMAVEQGLGSCWVQMRRRASSDGVDAEENVRAALGVPKRFRVVGALALGFPAREPKPHVPEEADMDRVHWVR